jgi:hypothetical protein
MRIFVRAKRVQLTTSSGPDATFATVIVGSGNEQKRFVVHESLLTHFSKFFRAALLGGFKEASDKIVPLHHQCPRIFELFVHWLYYQQFPDAYFHDDPAIIELFQDQIRVPKKYSSIDTLIKLHVFGDEYDVKALMKDTLDELFHQVVSTTRDVYMPPSSIDYAFEHLGPSAPMCRQLVSLTCYLDKEEHKDSVDTQSITSLDFFRMAFEKYRVCDAVNPDFPGANLFDPRLCDEHEHKSLREAESCWKQAVRVNERVNRQK